MSASDRFGYESEDGVLHTYRVESVEDGWINVTAVHSLGAWHLTIQERFDCCLFQELVQRGLISQLA